MILIAGLAFVAVVGVILAVWWAVASGSAVRARLVGEGAIPVVGAPTLLRPVTSESFPLLVQAVRRIPFTRGLERLADQAGLTGRAGEVIGVMILLAGVGAAIGGVRIGHPLGVIACAAAGAAVPVIYLRFRRQKRIEKFSEQFPEALDMMTRGLRAGYALGPAFQLVAEEMPDPVGAEFKRVFEQISLGGSPSEALFQMFQRLETEDVGFFYTVVNIQRDVGGNLAEILEKLSEVIRERFKLLSYARVLSAQHRASAYCVAASPLVMAIAFSLLSPGFFDPLLQAPIGKVLIVAALIMQFVGFLILKRIANITV